MTKTKLCLPESLDNDLNSLAKTWQQKHETNSEISTESVIRILLTAAMARETFPSGLTLKDKLKAMADEWSKADPSVGNTTPDEVAIALLIEGVEREKQNTRGEKNGRI
jgi:endo-1,4-beta-D-glucanase Y